MEAQHDNLQPVAPIGAFEEARLDEVLGAAGGEVDAPVRQAVAVQEKNITQVREKTLPSSSVIAFCSSSSLGMLSRQAGSVFPASSGFALELCKHFLPPCAALPTILVSTPGDSRSKETSSALEIPRETESEAYLNICYSEVAANRSLQSWLKPPVSQELSNSCTTEHTD